MSLTAAYGNRQRRGCASAQRGVTCEPRQAFFRCSYPSTLLHNLSRATGRRSPPTEPQWRRSRHVHRVRWKHRWRASTPCEMHCWARPTRGLLLETLSLAEFDRLERELPGVLLGREESLVVKPDPEFFLGLAGRYGDAADRAFFAAYKETYPTACRPPTFSRGPTTAAAQCSATVDLSVHTAGGRRSRSNFPIGMQRGPSRSWMQVGQQLQSTCACADATSVEQELQQFLLAFPQSSIFGPIRDRLQAIRGGRSKVRFHCTSRKLSGCSTRSPLM